MSLLITQRNPEPFQDSNGVQRVPLVTLEDDDGVVRANLVRENDGVSLWMKDDVTSAYTSSPTMIREAIEVLRFMPRIQSWRELTLTVVDRLSMSLRTGNLDTDVAGRIALTLWYSLFNSERELLRLIFNAESPVWVGDMPSSRDKDRLISLGLLTHVLYRKDSGHYALTTSGGQVVKEGLATMVSKSVKAT